MQLKLLEKTSHGPKNYVHSVNRKERIRWEIFPFSMEL